MDDAAIKTNKLCLANGDEFTQTEFTCSREILTRFIKVETEGKLIYVNPDYIISFEEMPLRIISS